MRFKLLLRPFLMASALLLVVGVAAMQASIQSAPSEAPLLNPIAQLQAEINSGTVKLAFDSRHGYLSSLLKVLDISPTSQMLVFSATSLQRALINPNAPRALYFNDHTYVGWVKGSDFLEIATVDPQRGAVFYQLTQEQRPKPKFDRQGADCLQCHEGSMTKNVPGLIMRSVYVRGDGLPDFGSGTYLTTDESPLSERWGGWYVTGTHGRQRHMGNAIARGPYGQVELDTESRANATSLSRYVDTSDYLTRYSDIVALMVNGHQNRIHNLITKAIIETKSALQYQKDLNRELKRPDEAGLESVQSRVKSVCEPLLDAMLFVHEAPLTDPVVGFSGFREQFEKRGSFDKRQRSLRQFDLKTRLLRYPLSYLVYSDAFGALPPIAKEYVYRRLNEVLGGQDAHKEYASLAPEPRKAILEILIDTKPDFAEYCRAHPKP